MKELKKHKILLLVHETLVPPENVEGLDTANAEWKTEYDVKITLQNLGHEVRVVGVYDSLSILRATIVEFEPHIVFNLLEEFEGISVFDHNIVGYLELLKIPYTGCNPRGLMLARDKALSKKVLGYHKIPVPKFFVCQKGHKPKIPKNMEFPLIVKSLVEEASRGISQASVVRELEKLRERVAFIHEHVQTDAIIEEYIPGKEYYVGVLGNAKLETFPVLELKFRDAPEDFVPIATSRAKWNEMYRNKYGIGTEIASDLPPELKAEFEHMSKRAYRKLNISGYARFDYRCTEEGELHLIEANPNPGIAFGEDYPEAAERAGYGYPNLLSKIISLGLSWHKRRGG